MNQTKALTRLHGACLIAGGLGLLWLGRHTWFFADEWEFITNRGFSNARVGILVPHTQHWSTLPIAVYSVLLRFFGLRTYIPYLAASLLIHCLAAHLVWRVCIRCGARPWVSLFMSAIFLFCGSYSQNLFWAFQISYNGSVALGLALLLLVDPPAISKRRELGAITVAIASLGVSAIALPAVAAATALQFIRRGWQAAVRLASVPAVVFGAWYLLVGRYPHAGVTSGAASAPDASLHSARVMATFVLEGLASSLAAPFRLNWLRWIVLGAIALGLAGLVWRRPNRASPLHLAFCAALAAFLFYAVAALGRAADPSLGGPTQPRYLYVGGAFLLPLVGLVISKVVAAHRLVPAVAAALLVGCLGANLVLVRNVAHEQTATNGTAKAFILGAASMAQSGQPYIADERPEQVFTPDLTMRKLEQLQARGWLPPVRPPDPSLMLLIREAIQIHVPQQPTYGRPSSLHDVVVGARSMTEQANCFVSAAGTNSAALTLALRTPITLLVAAEDRSTVRIVLRNTVGNAQADAKVVPTYGSTRYWLDLATVGTSTTLDIQGSAPVRICGATSSPP